MSRHSEYKHCSKPSIVSDNNHEFVYVGNYLVHDCAFFRMHARCHGRRRVTLSSNDVASRVFSSIPIINSSMFSRIWIACKCKCTLAWFSVVFVSFQHRNNNLSRALQVTPLLTWFVLVWNILFGNANVYFIRTMAVWLGRDNLASSHRTVHRQSSGNLRRGLLLRWAKSVVRWCSVFANCTLCDAACVCIDSAGESTNYTR